MRFVGSAFALAIACAPVVASAGVVFTDAFNTTGSSANYNTYITAGATGPSGDATFAYDYSALGIPAAPHTTDGSTKGLRVRTDNLQSSSGTIVGATEVSTKGIASLGTNFIVTVDIWSNYIGSSSGIASSGTNGSTGVAVGVGTSGNSIQYVAANDGLLVEGFGDNGGGANQAYRVYTDNTHPNPTTANYWAAGTSSTSASFSDPYYTSLLPSHTAPSAQTAISSTTQGGSTPAGVLGFAWHTFTITGDGTNIVWAVDGKTFTTVPFSSVNFGGSQVSLGNDDTGLTGSSSTNNQLFNAQIFDNLSVEITPEPASLSLVGLGAAGLVARRRRA